MTNLVTETYNRLKLESPTVSDAIVRREIGLTLAENMELTGINFLRLLWDTFIEADYVNDPTIDSTTPYEGFELYIDKYYSPAFKNGTQKLKRLTRIVTHLLASVLRMECDYTVDMLLDDNRLGKLSLITRFFHPTRIPTVVGYDTIEDAQLYLLKKCYDPSITYEVMQAEVQKVLGKQSKKRIQIQILYTEDIPSGMIISPLETVIEDIEYELSKKFEILYL